MIDFIKIQIFNEPLINNVWNNEILIYEGKSEKRFDDEIKELYSKSFKNLYFKKFQNRLEISGSLHYFFNDGLHNANDFSIQNCLDTINHIKELFQLDLTLCKLVNLEYGVNINPITSVDNLVHNIIYHEKRQFTRPTKHVNFKIAGNEAYKQIKAYDKSVQFPKQCINTFRFEVKTKQAKFINGLNIYSLNDLFYTDSFSNLKTSLVKEWDNVLVFDNCNNIDLKFLNTHFWEDCIIKGNRNKFNNQKKSYYNKLGNNNLQIQIKYLIQSKLDSL